MANGIATFQRSPPNGISSDVVNLPLGITQIFKCWWHLLVDDFEITTARQFFEFYEGEIWLNPCGVAVHNQPNRASWCDTSCLRIAETIFFAPHNRSIPRFFRSFGEGFIL